MAYTDFPINFHTHPEISEPTEEDLRDEADRVIRDLAKGHNDITMADVDIKDPTKGRETPFVYEATVTLSFRPNNIAATEKHNDPVTALKNALKDIERQVRDTRSRLRDKQRRRDDDRMPDASDF